MNIYNIVEKTVKKFQTANPFEICEKMNIKVIWQELPKNVNGFFVKILRNYVIIINESCSYEKAKFILAHELGHIIIHGGTNSIDIKSNTNLCVERLERQADCFAGHLLLKDSDFEFEELDIQITTERMSMLTGVPEDVLKIVL